MDNATLQSIDSSLIHINVAVWIVVVVLLVFTTIALKVLTAAYGNFSKSLTSGEAQDFIDHARKLLADANYDSLKEFCIARKASHPGESAAYVYLGIAHFRSKEWVEAKRLFEYAPTLNPEWKKVCSEYIELIERELKSVRPSLVNDQP